MGHLVGLSSKIYEIPHLQVKITFFTLFYIYTGSIWYCILGIGIVLLCFPGGGSFDSINTFEENEKSVM
jgi:hypothetical protein